MRYRDHFYTRSVINGIAYYFLWRKVGDTTLLHTSTSEQFMKDKIDELVEYKTLMSIKYR